MIDIAQAVTEWVGEILGDDIEVAYTRYTRDNKAAVVRADPSEPIVRKYLDGGGIYQFPYSVFLRMASRRDSDRYDALALLRQLQSHIENLEVPNVDIQFTDHQVTQIPNLFTIEQGGAEIYQLSANIQYRK